MHIRQSSNRFINEWFNVIEFVPMTTFTTFWNIFVQPHPIHVGLIFMACPRKRKTERGKSQIWILKSLKSEISFRIRTNTTDNTSIECGRNHCWFIFGANASFDGFVMVGIVITGQSSQQFLFFQTGCMVNSLWQFCFFFFLGKRKFK